MEKRRTGAATGAEEEEKANNISLHNIFNMLFYKTYLKTTDLAKSLHHCTVENNTDLLARVP